MPFEDENRNLRNRPAFAPGMDDDDDDDDLDFGDGGSGLSMRQQSFSSTPASPFADTGFTPQRPGGSPFGGIGGGLGMPAPQPQNQGPRTAEDAFWDGAKNVATGAKTFFGALQEAFSGHNYMSLTQSTRIMAITSGVGVVIAIVGMVLGLFLPIFAQGLAVIVGCLINLGTAMILYPIFYNKGREEVLLQSEPEPQFEPMRQEPPTWVDDEPEEEEEDPWGTDSDDWGDDEDEDNSFEEDDEDMVDYKEDDKPEITPPVDPLQALREMPDFVPGTQTRAAIYEQHMRVWPFLNPDFQDIKEIDVDSDLGNELQHQLTVECQKLGLNQEDYAIIDSISENGFMYTIRFTTTCKQLLSQTNRDNIADQLAQQMMFDMRTGYRKQGYEGFTGRSKVVGTTVFMYIFKGKKSNTLVSLADASRVIKDSILDTKNEMPVICGVGEQGNLYLSDYAKVESQIITGEPRSGKSWQAQSIIYQMCTYTSPRNLIFEVFDVKAETSDFTLMSQNLPHFRTFVSNPVQIVERLKYLTQVEAKRRSSILAQYAPEGIINIKDLHEQHPEVDMPYLYIIIDEMATLSGNLETLEKSGKKEYKTIYKEFKAYLKEVATKTPNLGIRGIYIAHRLVENIIPKTVHEMIGSKMMVRAPKDDIEAQLGKKELFTYRLTQPGDMAMKDKVITQGQMVYNHGLAIATTNKANVLLYKFTGNLWKKFEPEFPIHIKEIRNGEQFRGVYAHIDYMKDPLGKGVVNTQPRQPQQTIKSGQLFSNQMERGYSNILEDDDDEIFFGD